MKLLDRLNFSDKKENQTAIKLFSKNRELSYYYENLCLYCANNNIDLKKIADIDFDACAYTMLGHDIDGINSMFYFWIDGASDEK